MTDRELMQQGYEVPLVEQLDAVPRDARLWIEDSDGMGSRHFPIGLMCHKAAEALRARLSAPEPEPVAWQSRMRPDWEENGWTQWKDCPKEQADNFWKTPRLHDWVYEARALYTAPPQREWQGLTDEERESIASKAGYNPLTMTVYEYRVIIQKETEAKLREKNGNL